MGESGGMDRVPEQVPVRIGTDAALGLTGSRHIDTRHAQDFGVAKNALSQAEDVEPEDTDAVTRLHSIQGLLQRLVEVDGRPGRDPLDTWAVLADGGDPR